MGQDQRPSNALITMNEAFTPPLPRPTTRAADGLPRWRWTVEEIERIAAAGFFRGDERFELLGGETAPMSPKGRRHEIIRGNCSALGEVNPGRHFRSLGTNSTCRRIPISNPTFSSILPRSRRLMSAARMRC